MRDCLKRWVVLRVISNEGLSYNWGSLKGGGNQACTEVRMYIFTETAETSRA